MLYLLALQPILLLTDHISICRVAEEVVNEGEKTLDVEKPSGEENAAADGDKDVATTDVEEKPEDKVKGMICLYYSITIISN